MFTIPYVPCKQTFCSLVTLTAVHSLGDGLPGSGLPGHQSADVWGAYSWWQLAWFGPPRTLECRCVRCLLLVAACLARASPDTKVQMCEVPTLGDGLPGLGLPGHQSKDVWGAYSWWRLAWLGPPRTLECKCVRCLLLVTACLARASPDIRVQMCGYSWWHWQRCLLMVTACLARSSPDTQVGHSSYVHCI